jgi:hypothetical protein
MSGATSFNPANALAATVTVIDQQGKVIHNSVSSFIKMKIVLRGAKVNQIVKNLFFSL